MGGKAARTPCQCLLPHWPLAAPPHMSHASVATAHTRMSNLRRLMSSGSSTYFCGNSGSGRWRGRRRGCEGTAPSPAPSPRLHNPLGAAGHRLPVDDEAVPLYGDEHFLDGAEFRVHRDALALWGGETWKGANELSLLSASRCRVVTLLPAPPLPLPPPPRLVEVARLDDPEVRGAVLGREPLPDGTRPALGQRAEVRREPSPLRRALGLCDVLQAGARGCGCLARPCRPHIRRPPPAAGRSSGHCRTRPCRSASSTPGGSGRGHSWTRSA